MFAPTIGAAPLAVALLAAGLTAQPSVATIRPTLEGRAVSNALLADLDGDGIRDLVVATHAEGEPWARYLQVHRGRTRSATAGRARTTFGATPDHGPWTLSDRIVAWAAADVDPAHPGDEVVLYARGTAIHWDWPVDAERPRVGRLTETGAFELVWSPASPIALVDWQAGCLDVDGDGDRDLVVPEPDGYRVFVREPDGLRPAETLRVPERLAIDDRAGRLRFEAQAGRDENSFSSGLAAETGLLLRVRTNVPTPRAGFDWNGDGAPDLFAMLDDRLLLVWPRDASLPRTPVDGYELPPGWRTGVIDPPWRVLLGEIDGRPGADLLVGRSEAGGGDARTLVGLFLGRGAASSSVDAAAGPERPDETLRLDGLAAPPQLADIDGDGRLDLIIGTTSPDWVDTLRAGAGAGRAIEGRMRLFLARPDGSGRVYGRDPSAAIDVAIDPVRLAGVRRNPLFRMPCDADGDGVLDLLLHGESDEIALHRCRLVGEDRLALDREPAWRIDVDADARIVTASDAPLSGATPAAPAELLVVSSQRVLFVGFR